LLGNGGKFLIADWCLMKLNKMVIALFLSLVMGILLVNCGSGKNNSASVLPGSKSYIANGNRSKSLSRQNGKSIKAQGSSPVADHQKSGQDTVITTTTIPVYGSSPVAPLSQTLPSSRVLSGTDAWGPLQSIGPVSRISIEPLRPHESLISQTPPLGFPNKDLVSIGYRSFGQGQSLVLIGGEDTTMTSWSPALLLALAQNFHVVIFDLPGTGYSPTPLQKINLANMADDTSGLIASLGLKTPIVLGWGFGGAIALRLAETHPGLASGLILVDTTAGGKEAKFSKGFTDAVNPYNYSSLAKLWFPSTQAAIARGYLKSLGEYAPDVLLPQGALVSENLNKQLKSINIISDQLSKIDIPTLIVAGGRDEIFPVYDSYLLHRNIRASKIMIYRPSGYASIFAKATDFAASLGQFESTTTTTTTAA